MAQPQTAGITSNLVNASYARVDASTVTPGIVFVCCVSLTKVHAVGECCALRAAALVGWVKRSADPPPLACGDLRAFPSWPGPGPAIQSHGRHAEWRVGLDGRNKVRP